MQETQETRVQSLGWEDPLEEGMATHSSILAWRIPWTEEPSGLQSMGLQRVWHRNWTTQIFFELCKLLQKINQTKEWALEPPLVYSQQVASTELEIGWWEQSCRTQPLTPGDLMLSPRDSVRTELNYGWPSWCHRISWCEEENPHVSRIGSRIEQLELLHMAGRNINWYSSTLQKCLTASAKAEHVHTW